MNIATNTTDSTLIQELKKRSIDIVDISQNPRGAFLCWINPSDKDGFERQTKIVDYCVKNKKPLIIFDKYQEIPDDMVGYLVSNGAFLWEPAVRDRLFFSYQPVWGKIPKGITDTPLYDWTGATYDLANLSSPLQKIPSIEKYYKAIKDIGRHTVVAAECGNRAIDNEIERMGIHVCGRGDIQTTATVLIGTKEQYKTGYLDPNFLTYLESGIIPFLPEEHRWYYSIFTDLVINSTSDMDYFLSSLSRINYGLTTDIYSRIREHLPEFDVSNVADRIHTYLK